MRVVQVRCRRLHRRARAVQERRGTCRLPLQRCPAINVIPGCRLCARVSKRDVSPEIVLGHRLRSRRCHAAGPWLRLAAAHVANRPAAGVEDGAARHDLEARLAAVAHLGLPGLVGLEAATQVPQVDEEDELHEDEAGEEPAEAGGVLLDEAHQLVEEVVVALGAGEAEVVAAVAEREDLVEGVADARRRREEMVAAGHIRAELKVARVLQRDLDVGAHAVHTPSGARAVDRLRAVAAARLAAALHDHRRQVELRVAAALLVERAHEALDVGKRLRTELALVPAVVLALQLFERLVGHVLDDVDPPAEQDGQGHLHDEQQEPHDPDGRHGLVRAALDADERGGAHEEEHEAEREEDDHDRLADEGGHLLAEELDLGDGVGLGEGECVEDNSREACEHEDDRGAAEDAARARRGAEELAQDADERERREHPHAEEEELLPADSRQVFGEPALARRLESRGRGGLATVAVGPGVALRVARAAGAVVRGLLVVRPLEARVGALLTLRREVSVRLIPVPAPAVIFGAAAAFEVFREVIAAAAAAGLDVVASLLVAPRHALRRAVVGEVPAQVFHRGEGDGAHGVHGAAVGHDLVAHDARLPVRGATQLGQPHERQAVPRAVARAAEVALRELVRAPLAEEPHLVGGAVEVLHLAEGHQALALALRVGGRAELEVGEAKAVDDLVDDEGAVLLQELLRRVIRKADDLLDPREDNPRGSACNDVGRHARHAVVRRHRRTVDERAVARARLLRRVTLAVVHARVPPQRVVKGEGLIRADQGEEALHLLDHEVHDRLDLVTAHRLDDVVGSALAPAVLVCEAQGFSGVEARRTRWAWRVVGGTG
eukprot:scaffold66439_cov67-Phaeocystis_antarctica.AAC.2